MFSIVNRITYFHLNKKAPEPLTSNKSFMVVIGAIGLLTFLFLTCCFCFKVRKGLMDDADDSVVDSDAYQTRGSSSHLNTSGFMSGKKLKQTNGSFPGKIIKGIKGISSFDYTK